MKYCGLTELKFRKSRRVENQKRFLQSIGRLVLYCSAALAFALILPLTSHAQNATGATRSRSTIRTITNEDLERYRRARITADKADELERKELGLPSREEIRRMQQEQDLRLREMALQFRAEQILAEASAKCDEAEDYAPRNEYQNSYPALEPYGYQDYWPYVGVYPFDNGSRSFRRGRFGLGGRFGFGDSFGNGFGFGNSFGFGGRFGSGGRFGFRNRSSRIYVAPGFGVRSPRFGIRSPRVGIASPRVGIASPRVGISSPRVAMPSRR
jgi:hypothetical protein